ncbi:hypothetical protein VTN77DRAFT_3447 [Rasamsonia byssochlamydoides]|uniref:uncharacterized protein n=1 Tax=Rasamsonia byssochlamydoides TaxID=89139 RepID=UPI00374419EA
MTRNLLWHIWFLQVFDLFICQSLAPNLNRFIQSSQIAEADNRDGALPNDPCQGHLAHLPALLLCQLLHSADDLLIGFGDVFDCCGTRCLRLAQGPRKEASVERRPGDQPDSCLVAEFVHLPLFLTVAERVVVLHADELCPAVFLRDELQCSKLVCFNLSKSHSYYCKRKSISRGDVRITYRSTSSSHRCSAPCQIGRGRGALSSSLPEAPCNRIAEKVLSALLFRQKLQQISQDRT